ncbi:ABC-2 type transport system permease protein [Nocardioides zeae]|uniref:ABC-2 type transport system permease protein n=1 Tax=Nocardioides zeae TaxID=1457234 RepID=A0ACC6IH81_9ACTN|nr:ABC transporter permease [Nocardioides zeae]MDR6172988.1 ABC-2 type transport system permease protein [Nocardioides zeae]MDR6209982.1 ABC-2 type transport system permease protein [Nocardioides zeae]
MVAAIRSELTKLTSTRMWWVLALAMCGYLAFIGAVMAFALTVAAGDATAALAPVEGEAAATTVYGLVNAVGYAFPLLAGSMLMTSEFRHRTITQTLLVEPRRTVVLVAKLAVSVPLGLVYGVAGAAGIVGAAAPVLAWRGDGAHLGSGEVWRVIALTVVVTVLWTVIGTGFGAVLTQQVAAIVVILVFTQFVEPVARVALGAIDGLDRVAMFLPGAAADGLIGSAFFAEMGEGELLPRWAAGLVLLAYAAGLALVGRLTTLRRDLG